MNTYRSSKVFSFILTFCIASISFAETYYVSPTGNDSNPGTETSPWETPGEASSNASPGDTIIFKDGVYPIGDSSKWSINKKGLPGQYITYKSENLHGAKITHSSSTGPEAMISIGIYNSGWVEKQEMYTIIDGFDIQGGRRHAIQAPGGGQLIIRNNKIHDTGNDPIKINSMADYVLIENNEIYNSGLSDACDPGCNSDGIDITSSDYITVRNNHIHDIISWGIYTKKGATNAIVEQNLFHDIGEGGIGLGESTVTYDSIARNNILYNVADSCLQAAGAKDSGFYNNTCYNVSTSGGTNWAGIRIAPAQWVGGAKEGDNKFSRNVTVQNNIVVLNNAEGACFKSSDPALDGATKNERLAELHMDNNSCSNLQEGNGFQWIFEGKTLEGMAAWREFSASLGSEQDTNSNNTLPNFLSVDPTNANFLVLAENSSGVQEGKIVSNYVTDDYSGTLRDTTQAYDLGALTVSSISGPASLPLAPAGFSATSTTP
mgnify:FL=1